MRGFENRRNLKQTLNMLRDTSEERMRWFGNRRNS